MHADHPLHRTREIWTAWETGGLEGFLRELDDDVELCSHLFQNESLRPADMRARWGEMSARGQRVSARAERFEQFDHSVLVEGHLRVDAPGRLDDKHMWWIFQFDGARLRRAISCTSRRAAMELLNR